MVSRFERFTVAISALYRYWHKIAADEMKKYGLKGPYAVYLVAMSRHPQGVTATKLCEDCSRDKADVSRAVAAMEHKGLVRREENNGSLYRGQIKLTPAGEKAARHVRACANAAVEIGGKGLSDEQRRMFYGILDTIAANLEAFSKEGSSLLA